MLLIYRRYVAFHPEVDQISQLPVVVISHGGSMAKGHYVVYSQVGGVWFLNDDDKRLFPSHSPFEQMSIYKETVDIIVFQNN